MITLKQYYQKIAQLETPGNLKGIAEINQWWQKQFADLRAQLSETDLTQLQVNEKHWQDKVNSSLE